MVIHHHFLPDLRNEEDVDSRLSTDSFFGIADLDKESNPPVKMINFTTSCNVPGGISG